jgi:hypothetical protein
MELLNKLDCAIVIPSCDAYEDSWYPFFTFFFKYWQDCPFPVYLITDNKTYPDPRVTTIALGQDMGWANNMKIVLEQIPQKYFIYFLEDVFLKRKVDTNRIITLLEKTKKYEISCLRLFPEPGPTLPFPQDKELGLIAKDAPYRVSTMTAIWLKKTFIDLLKAGESAWQMEIDGTRRSSKTDELFVSVWQGDYPIDYFATAIKKGRWLYDAVKMCKKERVNADFTKREVESFAHSIIRKLAHMYFIGRPVRFIYRLVTK